MLRQRIYCNFSLTKTYLPQILHTLLLLHLLDFLDTDPYKIGLCKVNSLSTPCANLHILTYSLIAQTIHTVSCNRIQPLHIIHTTGCTSCRCRTQKAVKYFNCNILRQKKQTTIVTINFINSALQNLVFYFLNNSCGMLHNLSFLQIFSPS